MCFYAYNNNKRKRRITGDVIIVCNETREVIIMFLCVQSDYETLRAYTYKESEVLVLCFSVCDRESFYSVVNSWVPEIKRHTKKKRPVLLVGTQIDLRQGTQHEVTTEEGADLAKIIGADCYIECSARSRVGLKQVFEHVVFSALKCRKKKSTIFSRFFGR